MKSLSIYCLFLIAAAAASAFVILPQHHAHRLPTTTPLHSRLASMQLQEQRKALNDIDIMCIMNAADLCSYYDECDLEERQALLNRLEEQTDILSERIAMMSCLVKHLQTGDHKHLEDAETANLKATILKTVDSTVSTRAPMP